MLVREPKDRLRCSSGQDEIYAPAAQPNLPNNLTHRCVAKPHIPKDVPRLPKSGKHLFCPLRAAGNGYASADELNQFTTGENHEENGSQDRSDHVFASGPWHNCRSGRYNTNAGVLAQSLFRAIGPRHEFRLKFTFSKPKIHHRRKT
jgi:hypothetical protein